MTMTQSPTRATSASGSPNTASVPSTATPANTCHARESDAREGAKKEEDQRERLRRGAQPPSSHDSCGTSLVCCPITSVLATTYECVGNEGPENRVAVAEQKIV